MSLPAEFEKEEEKPVNRLIVCISAMTIFGLYYTIKFKKTLKWLSLVFSPYVILFLGYVILELLFISGFEVQERDYHMLDVIGVIVQLIVFIGSISLMYDWASKYNLKNFGYESKKEWKMNKRNTVVQKELKKDKEEKPVNRLIVCILSPTIFGFIYAEKFNKNLKFLMLLSIPFVFTFLLVLTYAIGDFEIQEPRKILGFDNSIVIALLFVFPIIFMYRWASQYNLKNFGFKSKRQWNKNREL